ncbi:AMP-binding protein [Streptomyces sp. DG1A-41]|uniref:AMP-binding protein n=1 Tax=Streptomyces sp. DG1A-41 TaxID=3125779 RepID=UPI0030CB05E0
MCVAAGAPSGPALRAAVEETLGAPLLGAYGSTETCGMIACGPPVPGMDVRVVDPRSGEDVPDGAEGEVWVRAPSLMTGYHAQPEATAAALRDGWYRTGDLGRRVEHGRLRLTGRVGELIIRGGENILVAPVLSSAMHLATCGGLLAARSINSCLAGSLDEDRLFAEFETRHRHEYGLFHEFLVSSYDMRQDERSYFWKARKVTSVGTTELEAFVELVGGLASGDASLTEAAGPAGERLTAVADDFERAVRRLPDADDLRNPLYESESFRQVFQEGPSHRNAGVFGGPLESEALLRPGGLVASEDGPAWVEPEGR